eukprot:TRINITY_DN9782_c0_g3_i1.p1 TRINITY_DN9782_c0_g3~~TRINITY_DN9782_c0_g3_i1.p1  ORF type:complete len:349 (+),score=60.97 TRINITY_DN9782_c0_g3_i1:52-1098(+)
MSLPELFDSQLKRYGEELREADHIAEVRREFNGRYRTGVKLRRPAGGDVQVDTCVEQMKSLLRGVRTSFATFRNSVNFFHNKVRLVAKTIKSARLQKRTRIAALFCAWLEYEAGLRRDIQSANSCRPPGEVKQLMETKAPDIDMATRQAVLTKFYRQIRVQFHVDFKAWHHDKNILTTRVKKLKTSALLWKDEKDSQKKAQEQLAAEPLPTLAQGNNTMMERLEEAIKDLNCHLCTEPRFSLEPTNKNLLAIMEISRDLAVSRAPLLESSFCSRPSSRASSRASSRPSSRHSSFLTRKVSRVLSRHSISRHSFNNNTNNNLPGRPPGHLPPLVQKKSQHLLRRKPSAI